MIEAMIDIETLDTKPSAVVLSIAVVIFGTNDFSTEPGGVNYVGRSPGATLALWPSLKEQIEMGRTVNAETVRWWCQQDERAFENAFAAKHDHIFRPTKRWSLADCAGDLKDFMNTPMNVWALPPSFDLVILESLFGGDVPWNFRQARDVRTLRDEAKLPPDFTPPGKFVPHDPISDCRWQIAQVEEARRLLANRNG